MAGFVTEYYLLLKALHIVSFTAWMAGMFYLPRLFVYHAGVAPDSEAAALFKVMERRLLRVIMTPALLATLLLGGLLAAAQPGMMQQGWIHAKIGLVLVMLGLHGHLAACRRHFAAGVNTRPARYYRLLNEAPTLLFLGVVLLAVLKPF